MKCVTDQKSFFVVSHQLFATQIIRNSHEFLNHIAKLFQSFLCVAPSTAISDQTHSPYIHNIMIAKTQQKISLSAIARGSEVNFWFDYDLSPNEKCGQLRLLPTNDIHKSQPNWQLALFAVFFFSKYFFFIGTHIGCLVCFFFGRGLAAQEIPIWLSSHIFDARSSELILRQRLTPLSRLAQTNRRVVAGCFDISLFSIAAADRALSHTQHIPSSASGNQRQDQRERKETQAQSEVWCHPMPKRWADVK